MTLTPEQAKNHRVPDTRGHQLFRRWLREERLSLRLAAVRLGVTSTTIANYKCRPPRRAPAGDVILAIQVASGGAINPEDWLTHEEQKRVAAVANRMAAGALR